MYQNTGANIDIRLGAGKAVVQDKVALDLSTTGDVAGRNSKQGKRRIAREEASSVLDDLELDKKGMPIALSNAIVNEKQSLVEWSSDPKNYEDPNFLNEFHRKVEELKINHSQAELATKKLNDLETTLNKEDKTNWENTELIDQMYSPEYGVDPNSNEPGGALGSTDVSARILADLNSVKKVYEYEYDIDDYATQESGYSTINGDRKNSSSKLSLTPESKTKLTADATNMFKSGLSQLEGRAIANRQGDITFVNDVIKYTKSAYGKELNPMSPEEQNKFFEEKAVEFLEQEFLSTKGTISKSSSEQFKDSKAEEEKSRKKLENEGYGTTQIEANNYEIVGEGSKIKPKSLNFKEPVKAIQFPSVKIQTKSSNDGSLLAQGTTGLAFQQGGETYIEVYTSVKPSKDEYDEGVTDEKSISRKKVVKYDDVKGQLSPKTRNFIESNINGNSRSAEAFNKGNENTNTATGGASRFNK